MKIKINKYSTSIKASAEPDDKVILKWGDKTVFEGPITGIYPIFRDLCKDEAIKEGFQHWFEVIGAFDGVSDDIYQDVASELAETLKNWYYESPYQFYEDFEVAGFPEKVEIYSAISQDINPNDIYNDLYRATDEIFTMYQERLGITSGDADPLTTAKFDDALYNLADVMADLLKTQKTLNASVRTNNGKKSVNASKRRAIKADVDYFQLAVDVFNNSLARLNEYFKGEVTFKAVVGDVFGAKHTGLYEDDGEAFMYDVQNLVDANGYSVLVNDYLADYLNSPLYQAVINGTQEQYITDYISGEDPNNVDPTVYYGFEDEWQDTFERECYDLAWTMADAIAKYLTNFSMIVEDTDVAFYEDNAGEIELTEDYGDWIIE